MAGGEAKISIKNQEAAIKDKKELDYFLTHLVRYIFILEVVEKLHLPIGAKILDTGCYPPHLLNNLREQGFDVWGISSKHEPVKDNKIVSLNIEKEKLPFKDDFFDLIIFTEIIEHLLVDPKVYLEKLKKVLKPNGRLLITTPNAVHLKNRMKVALGQSSHFSLNQLYETKIDDDSIYYRHNREFTFAELKQIVSDNGLKIYKSGYFSAYTPFRKRLKKLNPVSWIIKSVGFFLTVLYPSFKDSIFIVAGKKS